MKAFTSSDLKQNVGDVLFAASNGPVAITKHDKARYVLMTLEEFDRRKLNSDPRKVFTVEETPDEVHAVLMEELDRQLGDLNND